MAGEDDPLGNLMKSAIEEVNNCYTSVESSEIKEETFVTPFQVTLITKANFHVMKGADGIRDY